MKSTIAAIAVTLALVGSAFSQTKSAKIGDAYGVAAVRTAIQFVNDWDKSGALLNELEAQITNPAEQASYDGMLALLMKTRTGQKAVNDKYSSLAKEAYAINGTPEIYRQWKIANAAYAASLQPCFTALKTNLQHRDGTIPQECMAPTK